MSRPVSHLLRPRRPPCPQPTRDPLISDLSTSPRPGETTESPAAARPLPVGETGIAIVANDRVFDWLLPFLESWQATNAQTPLYIIPYDDNLALTRRAADLYGVKLVTEDSRELDALASRLYPLFPSHRRRLRKFMATIILN